MIKYYAFQILCAVASAAMLAFRPFPGWAICLVACVIIAASCILTIQGEEEDVDDMWWRIAIAILAPLLIGLGGAA